MSLVIRSPRTTKATPRQTRDAELHFTDGELGGLKLIGFSIWNERVAAAATSLPARQYAVNGERRSFALLRPITDASAQERVRELVLQAFAEYVDETASETAS